MTVTASAQQNTKSIRPRIYVSVPRSLSSNVRIAGSAYLAKDKMVAAVICDSASNNIETVM